ncbi:hypothetical protein ABMB67_004026 [Halalkalibacter oceani]
MNGIRVERIVEIALTLRMNYNYNIDNENYYQYKELLWMSSSLLIVGADRLGSIPKKLEQMGFSEINHVSGRKVQMVKKEIPAHIDLILVLTDFINHNLTSVLKKKAAEQDIPICYAKRSWCSIYQAIGNCEYNCVNKEQCQFASKAGKT